MFTLFYLLVTISWLYYAARFKNNWQLERHNTANNKALRTERHDMN